MREPYLYILVALFCSIATQTPVSDEFAENVLSDNARRVNCFRQHSQNFSDERILK